MGLMLVLIAAFWLPHIACFGVTRMRMSVEFILILLAFAPVPDPDHRPVATARVDR